MSNVNNPALTPGSSSMTRVTSSTLASLIPIPLHWLPSTTGHTMAGVGQAGFGGRLAGAGRVWKGLAGTRTRSTGVDATKVLTPPLGV